MFTVEMHWFITSVWDLEWIYLSINADDPLPSGRAMFKFNAMDPVAQGHLPHSHQVVRHPELSDTARRSPEKHEVCYGPPVVLFTDLNSAAYDFFNSMDR